MRTLFGILIAAMALSAADLDDNTVTVTATRTPNVQPDLALVSVNLVVAQDAGLDDVLAKLNGTGIAAANLTSVSQAFGLTAAAGGPYSEWMFSVQVPFTNLKSALAALTQAQAGAGSISGSNALTFYVSGTQVSTDAQAAQPCPFTALVSDARRQADSMAAAAGMRTGAIVSVSNGAGAAGSFTAVYDPTTGRPFAYANLLGPVMISAQQPSCSLTVQFKLVP